MKFLCKEEVTKLRGSVGSDGRVGLPARVPDAGHVKPRRDRRGIPVAGNTTRPSTHIFGTVQCMYKITA